MESQFVLLVNAEDFYVRELPKNQKILKKGVEIRRFQEERDSDVYDGGAKVGILYVKHPFFCKYFPLKSPEKMSVDMARYTSHKISDFYSNLGAKSFKQECIYKYVENSKSSLKLKGKSPRIQASAEVNAEAKNETDAIIKREFSSRKFCSLEDAEKIREELKNHPEITMFKSHYNYVVKGGEINERFSSVLTEKIDNILNISTEVSTLEGISVSSNLQNEREVYERISTEIFVQL